MDDRPLEELTDEEYDEAVARRVRLVGLVVLAVALGLIGLSALTLKADQVNQLPRSNIGGMPTDGAPTQPVEPTE